MLTSLAYDAPSPVCRVLDRVLPGWRQRPDEGALLRVSIDGAGYRVTGVGVDECAADAWEAAHWVIAAALGAEVEAVQGRLVLHAAGLRWLRGITVLAGEGHAGKSSVSYTHLTLPTIYPV